MTDLETIKAMFKIDRMRAGETMARALMAGDPDTFKAGYSRENALLATVEMLSMTDSERDTLRERLPNL